MAILLPPNVVENLIYSRESLWQTMQQLEFQLDGEYVELNQLLKIVGLCDSGGSSWFRCFGCQFGLLKMVGLCDSGGAGNALVGEGVVSVDGQIELRKTAKIRAGSVVTLGDVQISVMAG